MIDRDEETRKHLRLLNFSRWFVLITNVAAGTMHLFNMVLIIAIPAGLLQAGIGVYVFWSISKTIKKVIATETIRKLTKRPKPHDYLGDSV